MICIVYIKCICALFIFAAHPLNAPLMLAAPSNSILRILFKSSPTSFNDCSRTVANDASEKSLTGTNFRKSSRTAYLPSTWSIYLTQSENYLIPDMSAVSSARTLKIPLLFTRSTILSIIIFLHVSIISFCICGLR